MKKFRREKYLWTEVCLKKQIKLRKINSFFQFVRKVLLYYEFVKIFLAYLIEMT